MLWSGLSEEGGRKKGTSGDFLEVFWESDGALWEREPGPACKQVGSDSCPPDVQGQILRARDGDTDKGTTSLLPSASRIFWEGTAQEPRDTGAFEGDRNLFLVHA